MSRTTLLALAAGAAMLVAALLMLGGRPRAGTEGAAARPRVALLTSLPLLFGEEFALRPPANTAVERIGQVVELVPIAVADRASLNGFSRLLMAHPRAQPAEVLVELDAWVRGGGQIVVLADPALAWQSARPPGDPLRPPPDFADTGLLGHWGLRLGVDEAGEGTVRATSRACSVSDAGLVAQCRVGKGNVSIIADADFLMGVGTDAPRRLALLMAQLAPGESR
jgi:hypothetical protein